nr:immunoglobulin heavy chain junction region [Macaca mulatta]
CAREGGATLIPMEVW